MKNILLAIIVIYVSIAGCSKVEYDYKALGFTDKAAMEAAFSKGYHTKQKLDEITEKAATCSSVKSCAEAMLSAASTENIAQAMEAAKRIDGMPKPERGDRKTARRLNKEGLDALKQNNFDQAISNFIQAKKQDPIDEEIIGNLAYSYGKKKDYAMQMSVATDGLLLNPRRANLWMGIAEANKKSKNDQVALKAIWLAWQFSENKQKMLDYIEKNIGDNEDAELKDLYTTTKSWLVDGKRPKFN